MRWQDALHPRSTQNILLMRFYGFKCLCFVLTKCTSVWKEEKLACCFRWCFLFPFLSRVGSELETKQNISSSNWALFFSSQDLKTDNHLVNNNLCQLTYCSTISSCHKIWKVSSRPKASSFYLGYDNYSSSYDSLTLTSHVMSTFHFRA